MNIVFLEDWNFELVEPACLVEYMARWETIENDLRQDVNA